MFKNKFFIYYFNNILLYNNVTLKGRESQLKYYFARLILKYIKMLSVEIEDPNTLRGGFMILGFIDAVW